MNSTPSPRPRFVCRVVRLWHSVLGPPHPGSATGGRSRHIETCADCRQFFHAGDELETALRRDAVRYAPVPPEGIERRIMQAVERSTRIARPARSPLALILAGSAVAAVALIVFLVRYPDYVERDGVAVGPTAQVDDAVAVAKSIATLWQNSVVPSAQTLVADNPLQHELNSVYSDTRTALNFLALNFLPTTPATSAFQPAGAASDILTPWNHAAPRRNSVVAVYDRRVCRAGSPNPAVNSQCSVGGHRPPLQLSQLSTPGPVVFHAPRPPTRRGRDV